MPSSNRRHVAVVGSANHDLTAYTAVLPAMGETVMGQSFATSCGGKGANQACAAASLGLVPVHMICKVGADVFGDALLENFRDIGVQVDTKEAVVDDVSSGTATIVVDTTSGDNSIIVTPGANHALTPEGVDASLRALPEPPAVVVVQLEVKPEVSLQALKTAKEMGALTIFNPAPAPEGFSIEDFYPLVDIFIPNETELRKICGATEDESVKVDEEALARTLLDKGVQQAVVCTLGARGAMIVPKGDSDPVTLVAQPDDLPCKDDPVADTVGAGDGFCGALATYLSRSLDLPEAATKACGFASMSVRRRGASYPRAHELPACLQLEDSEDAAPANGLASTPTLTFVTGNANKLLEVERLLGEDLPFTLASQSVDVPEIQGEAAEIAKEKCRLAAETIKGPCFTEDTSLCFNSLHGLPGPYIKDFLQKCGHDGLLQILSGFDDKSAYASTILAYTKGPGEPVEIFEGRTDGTIVAPRGDRDFGWDPIFEPKESGGLTYAEMSVDAKNKISHRGRAFQKFQHFLQATASQASSAKEAVASS